jgi:hypothetical protein
MNLAQSIEAAHQQNEAKLAARIAAPRLEIEDEGKRLLGRFISFCKQNGVRYLPSAPATISAFIKAEYTAGATPEMILKTLEAIEIMHSQANAANPVACPAPRAALSEIMKIEGPRSWNKAERLVFASLPIEAQAIIERHAKLDSDAVRRAQNLHAKDRDPIDQKKDHDLISRLEKENSELRKQERMLKHHLRQENTELRRENSELRNQLAVVRKLLWTKQTKDIDYGTSDQKTAE